MARPRLRPPSPHPPPAYVMPLAVGATGLLLMMSLALHGLVMQEWLQAAAWERQRRQEDVLASAAHQLVAALNGPHPCLLRLPLAQWEVEGRACASPAALATLRRMEVMAVPVEVLAWQPRADGLSAEMELAMAVAPERGARKARFDAQLAGKPPQAVRVRTRFLGGALP